jgi:hypothetical protein
MTQSLVPLPRSPWRSPGPWLALVVAVMMAFNAWQAFTQPQAFAARFGTPGAANASTAFVTVYASRALFLAAITTVLLATRQYRALGWFAAVATVMPLADLIQVSAAGGSTAILARHLAIAIYLAVTAALLLRLARRTPLEGAPG